MDMEDNSSASVRFDGYDQAEKIGVGGMATVWKARQISLDRCVAIKVLSPEQCSDDEDIDRFQSEARIAARMNHPGIVQVYDAFYRNDRFCFVMEYVDGYTVGSWLRNRGFIPEEGCLFVAAGVAEALAYAWGKQMLIHCDIKPENIMIDIDGSVKVADFGLSKSMCALQARRMVAEGAYVFGTPAYISPEQAVGEKELTIQADMYSLGATLFHMCAGRRLFAENDSAEVMEFQVSSQDTDPFELNANLSPFFCDFIERLLCKKKEDRFGSWDDVISEIENLRQSRLPQYGEISPAKNISTVKRSPLRDAARAKLLKEMHRGKRKSNPPSGNPSSTRRPRQKLDVKIVVADATSDEGSSAPRSPIARSLNSLKTLFSSFAGKRGGKVAAIFILGVAVLLSITAAAFRMNREERRRVSDLARSEMVEIENILRVNPDQYDATIKRYDRLICLLDSPCHSELKQQTIRKRDFVLVARNEHVHGILEDLRRETRPLIEEKQFGKAAAFILAYDGVLAKETLTERTRMADMFNEQARLPRKSSTSKP